jgi:hypothetical protein
MVKPLPQKERTALHLNSHLHLHLHEAHARALFILPKSISTSVFIKNGYAWLENKDDLSFSTVFSMFSIVP